MISITTTEIFIQRILTEVFSFMIVYCLPPLCLLSPLVFPPLLYFFIFLFSFFLSVFLFSFTKILLSFFSFFPSLSLESMVPRYLFPYFVRSPVHFCLQKDLHDILTTYKVVDSWPKPSSFRFPSPNFDVSTLTVVVVPFIFEDSEGGGCLRDLFVDRYLGKGDSLSVSG